MFRDFGQLPLKNLFVQPLHILRLEWWFERHHLIYDAAQAPNITLDIIWLIFPNLGRCIVGCSCLRIIKTFRIRDFRYVHVSQLCSQISIEKNVRGLQISVHDFDFVHGLKTTDSLYKDLPNLSFFDIRFLLFVVYYFLENVTVIGKFHYNTR